MSDRQLAQLIEGLDLAQHAHTDFELELLAGESSGWIEWTPPAGNSCAIVYWFTYGNLLSDVFRVRSGQRNYPIGIKTVRSDSIQHGVAPFLYVTDRDPFLFELTNIDVMTHTFTGVFWHLNVKTAQRLATIKYVLWEYIRPGLYWDLLDVGIIEPIEDLPKRLAKQGVHK